jgi:hypothetical protein
MMNTRVVLPYELWPEAPDARADCARAVLGTHLTASLESWTKIAADLVGGKWRPKSPTLEQAQFVDWLATLGDRDRAAALGFSRFILRGVLFSALCAFDGVSGRALRDGYAEELRILLEVRPQDRAFADAACEPVESIVLNPRHSIQLHEIWYAWLAELDGADSADAETER